MEFLFVYGTLRQGGSNHDLLDGQFATMKRALAPDLALFVSAGGGFPYAVTGRGSTVLGDLVGFTDTQWKALLPRLDLLEGYDARRPDVSHYLRVRRPVAPDTGPAVTAFVYLASSRVRIVEGRRIGGGDWLQHTALTSVGHRPCETREA